MCRFLGIVAAAPVRADAVLDAFAERCRASDEYQGHGWGVAWRTPYGWERHRSLRPIWDDDRPDLPESALWIAHARSAFRNEGIVLGNNMPFLGGGLAFAFNGELHGVRLSVPGATGAARLFELLGRFHARQAGDVGDALERLSALVAERSRYVRAANLLVADAERLHVHCRYSEQPGYFTVHRASLELGGVPAEVVASDPVASVGDGAGAWEPLANGTTLTVGGSVTC